MKAAYLTAASVFDECPQRAVINETKSATGRRAHDVSGNSGIRAKTVVCLAAAWFMLLAPRSAGADESNEGLEVALVTTTVFTSLGLAAPGSLTFLTADVLYAARGSWLPPTWAKAQLWAGVAPSLLASAGYFLVVGTTPKTRRENDHATPGLLAVGAVHAAVGCWFLVHGLLSLKYYRPPNEASPKDATLPLRVSLAPVAGGGIAFASGQF